MRARDIVAEVRKVKALQDLRVIQGAVRARWSELQRDALNQFEVGDTVIWIGKGENTIRGAVVRKWTKSATIRADDGTMHRVDGSLLRGPS